MVKQTQKLQVRRFCFSGKHELFTAFSLILKHIISVADLEKNKGGWGGWIGMEPVVQLTREHKSKLSL